MNTPNSTEFQVPLDVGDVVDGRYTIESVLGRGGYGVVFKARQASTNQMVALKVLHAGADGERQPENQGIRFEREMRLIGQLKHPNIVRLIDFGSLSTGLLYTVMEFVDGKSLSTIIREEGGLRPSEAKYFMVQVANALSAAHELGIVYRDLKPANVMITRSGHRRNAVLLDFGISALVEEARYEGYKELTANGHIHGTPAYMAPEQLRSGPLTPQTDIYAWGLVFLECLTGQRVVKGDTFVEVIVKQLGDDEIEVPDELIRSPCGGILGQAVAKRLEVRYPNVGELIDDLEACNVPSSLVLPWTGKTAVEEIQRHAQRRSQTASISASNSWSGEFSVELEKMINSESVEIKAMLDDLDESASRPVPVESGTRRYGVVVGAAAILFILGGLGVVLWYALFADHNRTPAGASAALASELPKDGTQAVDREPEEEPPSGPETYNVKISATPSNATITIDGENVGSGNFVSKLPLDGKTHRILVEAEGFVPYRTTFVDTAPESDIELRPVENKKEDAPEEAVVASKKKAAPWRPRPNVRREAKPDNEVVAAIPEPEAPAEVAEEPAKPKKKRRRPAKKTEDWGGGIDSMDTPDPWK